jgi:hypothetical protein
MLQLFLLPDLARHIFDLLDPRHLQSLRCANRQISGLVSPDVRDANRRQAEERYKRGVALPDGWFRIHSQLGEHVCELLLTGRSQVSMRINGTVYTNGSALYRRARVVLPNGVVRIMNRTASLFRVRAPNLTNTVGGCVRIVRMMVQRGTDDDAGELLLTISVEGEEGLFQVLFREK